MLCLFNLFFPLVARLVCSAILIVFAAGLVTLLPQAFNTENHILLKLKLKSPIQLCKIWLKGLSSIGIYFFLSVLFNMGDKVKSIILWIGGGRDLNIMGGLRARAVRGVMRERERLRLAAVHVPVPVPAFVPGMYAVSSADRAAAIRAADIVLKNAVRVAIAAEAYAAVMRNATTTANLPTNIPHIDTQPIPHARARAAVDVDNDDGDYGDDDSDDAAISDDGHVEEVKDDLASYIDGLIVTSRIFYEGLLEHPWDDVQMKCLDCLWIGFLKPVLLIIFRNTLLLICK